MGEQKAFEDLSIEEVLALVESGEYTPEQALDIERQGKGRKTLIAALQKMVIPDDPVTEDQNESKVRLLKNIKYKRKWYSIGQEIEVDDKVREAFVKAGIIEGEGVEDA